MNAALIPASDLDPRTPDAALATRVAAGDHGAFTLLMRRHNQTLYRTARSILREDADAEDAVQEAYIQAYRAMGAFRAEAKLSTWLVRIVVNEALGRLRSNRRRAEVIPIDGDPERNAQAMEDVVSEDLSTQPEQAIALAHHGGGSRTARTAQEPRQWPARVFRGSWGSPRVIPSGLTHDDSAHPARWRGRPFRPHSLRLARRERHPPRGLLRAENRAIASRGSTHVLHALLLARSKGTTATTPLRGHSPTGGKRRKRIERYVQSKRRLAFNNDDVFRRYPELGG